MEPANSFRNRSGSVALMKVIVLGMILLRYVCWNGFGAATPAIEMGPLTVTHLRSDRNSGLVYAISEPPGQPAVLLEIDSVTESVLRVAEVGSSVTDLEIHYHENRIYVPNYKSGLLRAIDRSSFQTVQTYDFNPGTFSSDEDVFLVAAGFAGRLVIEEYRQTRIRLIDTVSGEVISSTPRLRGGGVTSSDGRYYYHGDSNGPGARIGRYDLTIDPLRIYRHPGSGQKGLIGSGTRTVAISEDDSHVFWANFVFDKNLKEIWNSGDYLYASTTTGRYAMSATKIYDIDRQEAILTMPANYTATTYNTTSEKLIVAAGDSIFFYPFSENTPYFMPTPTLSAEIHRYLNIILKWTDRSLETEFTIQAMQPGESTWTHFATVVANKTSWPVWNLNEETEYTFRIKATSGSITSDWSDPVSITTTYVPPRTPQGRVEAQNPFDLLIAWWKVDADFVHIEMNQSSNSHEAAWNEIGVADASNRRFRIKKLQPDTSYEFRLRSERDERFSGYSYFNATTSKLQIPSKPVILNTSVQEPTSLLVEWEPLNHAFELILSARRLGESEFVEVTRLEGDQTSFLHTGLNVDHFYAYQLSAVNAIGTTISEPTEPESPTMLLALEDNFENGPRSEVWSVVEGATNSPGGPAGSTAAQFFSISLQKMETIPLKIHSTTEIEFDLLRTSHKLYPQLDIPRGEWIYISIELNHGSEWIPLEAYSVFVPTPGWFRYRVSFDGTNANGNSRIRWVQRGYEGPPVGWGLDNVCISVQRPLPPSVPKWINIEHTGDGRDIVSWLKSNRADIYSVERSIDEEHSWELLGTTEELSFTAPKTIEGQVVGYRVAAQNDGGTSGFSQTLWSGKPNTVTVSGRVFFLGRKERPIQHAIVTLTQEGIEQQTPTDRLGHYQFEIPFGKPIEIRAELINYSKPNRGVDVADLIEMRTHILNRSRFSHPVEWLAADVNRDGSVDVSDIVQMRKVILNRDDAFSRDQQGYKHSVWRLMCADFTGINAENALVEFPNYTVFRYDQVTADISGVDFAAIKLGDSNGDWTLERNITP